jgi:hypothetical protein
VRATEFEAEPLGVTNPRDYRRGILFGSVLVVIGALIGVFWLLSDFEFISSQGPIVGMSFILGLAFPGLLIVTGLLLVNKGKLGLWMLYLCSAFLVFGFGVGVLHDVVSKKQDSVAGIIAGILLWGILFTMWFSIVGYFHNRRKQFTGLWSSQNETKAI